VVQLEAAEAAVKEAEQIRKVPLRRIYKRRKIRLI
jgi:hypothetical protein